MRHTVGSGREEDALARTTAEWVVERLKDDILTGRLAPGTKLVERDLAERYGVSRTPLREALNQLVVRQLATTVPYRGVFVRKVDLGFARDVYEVRSALEGLAGKLAAERATKDEIRLVEAHFKSIERLSRLQASDQSVRDDIMRNNTRFHRAIAVSAHNALLLNKIEEIWTSVSLVRFYVWQTEDRIESSLLEHAEMLEALRKRDGERMQVLCAEHAEKAWRHVDRVLRGGGDRRAEGEALVGQMVAGG